MKALVYLTATALMGVFFEASAQHTQPSGQHVSTENGFVLEVKNPEAQKLKMVIRGHSGAAVYKRHLGERVHYTGKYELNELPEGVYEIEVYAAGAKVYSAVYEQGQYVENRKARGEAVQLATH